MIICKNCMVYERNGQIFTFYSEKYKKDVTVCMVSGEEVTRDDGGECGVCGSEGEIRDKGDK